MDITDYNFDQIKILLTLDKKPKKSVTKSLFSNLLRHIKKNDRAALLDTLMKDNIIEINKIQKQDSRKSSTIYTLTKKGEDWVNEYNTHVSTL